MECPFKVGDRIRSKYDYCPMIGSVTKITDRGFTYRLDDKVIMGSPHFAWHQEGEVYECGFNSWEKI